MQPGEGRLHCSSASGICHTRVPEASRPNSDYDLALTVHGLIEVAVCAGGWRSFFVTLQLGVRAHARLDPGFVDRSCPSQSNTRT